MNTIYIPRDGRKPESLKALTPRCCNHFLLCGFDILYFTVFFPLAQSFALTLPSRRRTPTVDMRPFTLLPTLACLILIVAHRARGFSSGAPEESCDSLTVIHTHVGSPAPGLECDATCRQTRQLRLIGNSSANSFTYNCNETYQCELAYIRVWLQLWWVQWVKGCMYVASSTYPCSGVRKHTPSVMSNTNFL